MMPRAMISVVICTRNRAEKLRNALASLERMSLPPGLPWEVVVVDNASTDHTKQVVDSFANAARVPIRYAFEAKRGVNNAHNTGIRESKGEIIASIDDDCIVDRDWIGQIAKEFESDAAPDVLGGRVELYDKDDYAITVKTTRDRYNISSLGQLFGGIPGNNMIFSRAVAEKVGGYDPLFGPGSPNLAAGEAGFLYQALKSGFRLVYSPDVLVFHDHGRRTDRDISILRRSYVIGRGAFYCKYILKGDLNVARFAYWEISKIGAAILRGLRRGQPVSEDLRLLGHLALGAVYFIRASLGRRPASSKKPR